MKRFILPLILILLITAVFFVSCDRAENPTDTAQPETQNEQNNKTTTTEWEAPEINTGAARTTTTKAKVTVKYPQYTT